MENTRSAQTSSNTTGTLEYQATVQLEHRATGDANETFVIDHLVPLAPRCVPTTTTPCVNARLVGVPLIINDHSVAPVVASSFVRAGPKMMTKLPSTSTTGLSMGRPFSFVMFQAIDTGESGAGNAAALRATVATQNAIHAIKYFAVSQFSSSYPLALDVRAAGSCRRLVDSILLYLSVATACHLRRAMGSHGTCVSLAFFVPQVLTEAMVLGKSRADSLINVKSLNLWGNDLADVSILRRMPNAEVLSLSVNRISSLADFAYCPSLAELYLRKNDITDITHVGYLRVRPCGQTGCG